jgi:malonyl-CoA O-methyltransferase
MDEQPGALVWRDVERRFRRAAPQFSGADFVHRHAAGGLLDRLSPVQLDATRIIDLGSAAGRDRNALQKRFRKALVVGVDRSAAMLAEARRAQSWFSRSSDIRAAAEQLPVTSGSIDLVYANLLLPWIDDHAAVFGEVSRVLRKGGLFAFSTLGPDSLKELRAAWAGEDAYAHVRGFPDMHDVGDGLVRCGLRDPVLDVDALHLEYRDATKLFRDIVSVAAGNSLRSRRRSLTGKAGFERVVARLTGSGALRPITITLELVFGHAWGGGPPAKAGEFLVEPRAIGRRRR